MKQTIEELGIGGTGWIIYSEYNLPKRVVHIDVADNWDKDYEYRLHRYLLREHIVSNGVQTTRDLVVFANEIVYSTKEEAEEELKKEISKTITEYETKHKIPIPTAVSDIKNTDWKKMGDELGRIQKQFEDITEDQKKDLCTFIKKIRNIADPQPDDINWKRVRIDASISILNSLLETTKHSILEEIAVNEVYAKTAVAYADSLIKELKRSEAYFEEKFKKN